MDLAPGQRCPGDRLPSLDVRRTTDIQISFRWHPKSRHLDLHSDREHLQHKRVPFQSDCTKPRWHKLLLTSAHKPRRCCALSSLALLFRWVELRICHSRVVESFRRWWVTYYRLLCLLSFDWNRGFLECDISFVRWGQHISSQWADLKQAIQFQSNCCKC